MKIGQHECCPYKYHEYCRGSMNAVRTNIMNIAGTEFILSV